MVKHVHIDFETRSELDVTDVGSWAYAAHDSTDILCIAYAVDDGPVDIYERGALEYWGCMGGIECEELYKLASDPDVIFKAHNAFFEQCIWRFIMSAHYGYPEIPIRRWRCTAAKAAANALPRDLSRAGKALRLSVLKDTEGQRVMQTLARPRRPSIANPDRFWEPHTAPEKFETLYKYCANDVLVEREIDKALPELTTKEQELWFMDQEINMAGVKIDVPLIKKILTFIELRHAELLAEFQELTAWQVDSPKQLDKFHAWLNKNGAKFSDLQAATVDEALKKKDELPKDVVRALEIRQELSKSSTAKYEAMLTRATADDRVRDLLMFHGASTGRWSGKGLQPQNLPRPKCDIYTAVNAIKILDYEAFTIVYPDVMGALSTCTRGAFISEEGKDIIFCDFSAIEARATAWLAGQEDTLIAFASGLDIYCEEASKVFGRLITKNDSEERQVGKVSILSLGFNGGIAAYEKMGKTYRVNFALVAELIWPTTNEEEREKARFAYNSYRASSQDPLPKEQAMAVDVIKQRWRLGNPKIVRYWSDIEEAAIEAVRTKRKVRFRNLIWGVVGDFLYLKLPSGRCISYPEPKLEQGWNRFNSEKYTLTYMTIDARTKQYVRTGGYGGLFTENVAQAVARDLMRDAMFRARDAGYPTILTIHDEMWSEIDEDFGSVEEYERIMSEVPVWAEGMPVKAEGWRGKRYKK